MKPEMKKLIIANLPYLLFVYLFGKLGQTYRLAAGADLSEKLLHLADGFSLAFESAAPSFHLFDLAVGVAGAVALRLMVYCKSKNAKKYRRGVEYGSARWGGPKDIAPYIDPVFDNNILLTQTERLTMNNRPKDPKTARNKNVLVIGGSGSGKTRFFVKPNLMQCVSKDYPTSFVITDPKGSLIGEVGQLLVRCGYRVKVLNTINFSKSMRYNPFRYIHSEKDILKLVNTLICNTKGEGEANARRVLEDALAVQEAGAFAVTLECVPPKLSALITKKLDIITIGIGASPDCDAQVLVWQDMLGISDFKPKFAKHFAEVGETMREAFRAYDGEVKSGVFPASEHTFVKSDCTEEFLASLDAEY